MAQKISIEPELWIRVRHLAFDRGISASALVADALTRYLDELERGGSKRRGHTAETADTADRLRPVWADPFMADDPSTSNVAARVVTVSTSPATKETDEPSNATPIEFYSEYPDEPPPADWLDRPAFSAADLAVEPDADVFGIPVSVADEVDDVVAKVAPLAARTIRPVPKPTSKKKTSRTVRA